MILPATLLFRLPFTHPKAAAGVAAAADSAAAMRETIVRSVEGWHDFYLLAGTAAVTLVGLLFVALSFHLDTLLHDSRSHLLASARMAFFNFLYVLLLSLFMLMPEAPPAVLGVGVLSLSLVVLAIVAWNSWQARRPGALGEHEQFLRRRFALTGVVLGMAIAAAIAFLGEPHRLFLLQLVTVTCVMLANAAGTAWDLLVQVGRMRKAAGETPKA